MSNYAVYRVYKDWNKRPRVLMDGLTREQAQTIVKNTPINDNSMWCSMKNQEVSNGADDSVCPIKCTRQPSTGLQ